MKKAIKIEILFSESDAGALITVLEGANLWTRINEILRRIAMSCPADMKGYMKTYVKVTFEDGRTYECRMDVTPQFDDCDLAKHIQNLWRPNYLSFENYVLGDTPVEA